MACRSFAIAIPAEPTRDEAYHRVPVRGAEQLYAWLAEERPDILHVHSFTTGVGLPEFRAAAPLRHPRHRDVSSAWPRLSCAAPAS